YPTIVQAAVERFGHLFANEPERRHFAEYLTGLLVAQRKTVSGINAEFAQTTDQSCLNRWLTQVEWDVHALNRERLEGLQQDSPTRYSAHGVIPIDNVLVAHSGECIAEVGYVWDHAERRHLIAHDYVIANYVCTTGKHYPLEFRRFRKRDLCDAWRAHFEAKEGGIAAATAEEQARCQFKNHTELVQELITWVVEEHIPGDFTMDSYFTNAPILNHIHAQQRGYVGDLKFNRKVWLGGREMSATEVAAQIGPESRKPVEIDGNRQWYFTKRVHLPEVNHPVRIVLLWERKNGKEAHKILVTNRTFWEVTRILRVYRRRWTGTETFHRDGKQYLGMGDCQLRSREGQTRHMYLVILAHSLLVAEMKQGRVREWATSMLTTIGEACRAVLRETLGQTLTWAIDRAMTDGWSHEKIKAHLALA
ncbi:MAG: IS701 family transposase, partial [Acidobacteria bacterium]|nr:IS701 family transposase [Acidobacteriota bacterium]